MINKMDYYIDGVFREGLYLQDKEIEDTKKVRLQMLSKKEVNELMIFDDTDNDEVII